MHERSIGMTRLEDSCWACIALSGIEGNTSKSTLPFMAVSILL